MPLEEVVDLEVGVPVIGVFDLGPLRANSASASSRKRIASWGTRS